MSEVLLKIVDGVRNSERLPGVTFTVNRVVDVSSSDRQAIRNLADAILGDASISSRVLKIASSAMYARGREVDTIFKAILLLGFDTVRSLALSLFLLDRMKDPTQQRVLQAEIALMLAAVNVARALSEHAAFDPEKALIKTFLRHTGRLVSVLYATPEYLEVRRLMSDENLSEAQAAAQVLGARFEEIAEVAITEWGLPERYRHVPTTAEALKGPDLIALAGSQAADVLGRTGTLQSEEMDQLVKIHAKGLGLDPQKIYEAINEGREQFRKLLDPLGLPDVTAGDTSAILARAVAAGRKEIKTKASTERHPTGRPMNCRDVLAAGITQLRKAIDDDERAEVLHRLVTDVLHEAMGFQRTLLLGRDEARNEYRVRAAAGRDAHELMRTFAAPLEDDPNTVFHAAIARDASIHIEDVNSPRIAPRLPGWFAQFKEAQSFLLLPVVIQRRPVGWVYGDRALVDQMGIAAELDVLNRLKQAAGVALEARR